MTFEDLQERIKCRTLKTRGGSVVRKLDIARDLAGNTLYEVYVENIPWCLVTVDARTGKAEKNEEWDEDLIF